MWAGFDYHTCSMISRHVILWLIPRYYGTFHDITRYSMILRYIPWHYDILIYSIYQDIFHDILIYSIYQDIFHVITIYSMISRYIPHEFTKHISIPYCLLVSLSSLIPFSIASIQPVYFRNATSVVFKIFFWLCSFRSAAESRNVSWYLEFLWRWMLRLFFYNMTPCNLLDRTDVPEQPALCKAEYRVLFCL